MAKQKTQPDDLQAENVQPGTEEIIIQNTEEVTVSAGDNKETPVTTTPIPEVTLSKPPVVKKENTEVPGKEISPLVDSLLKQNSHYPALYIDHWGGCYTPNVSPRIRGNAILYKNPYYN
ncbi:MAG: hypothetical protein LBT83_05140 [Tannerella sp.]|jgi:hypothetical protein|nr:hypothetical protein [Tannerella sp.]